MFDVIGAVTGGSRAHPARAQDLRDVRAGVVDADRRGRPRRAVLQRDHQVRRLLDAHGGDVEELGDPRAVRPGRDPPPEGRGRRRHLRQRQHHAGPGDARRRPGRRAAPARLSRSRAGPVRGCSQDGAPPRKLSLARPASPTTTAWSTWPTGRRHKRARSAAPAAQRARRYRQQREAGERPGGEHREVAGRGGAVEVPGAAQQVAAGAGREQLPDQPGGLRQHVRAGGGARERVADEDHRQRPEGDARPCRAPPRGRRSCRRWLPPRGRARRRWRPSRRRSRRASPA